jgi:3-oxoacyl-[acyl-carrier-protein] synthase-3
LQNRLGLSTGCAAFDVNLGCSGFVYGLWLGGQIVAGGGVKRLLVLAGDISTRRLAPRDRSVVPLFGDAGTAMALEYDAEAPPMNFELGTDGAGFGSIIIPASGFRQPRVDATKIMAPGADGIERSPENIYINGADVFNFTIKRVPPLVEGVIAAAGLTKDDYDFFVFHQANAFMLHHLAKRLKLPPEKFIVNMETVGNTSSASIPLAITMSIGDAVRAGHKRLLLCGFGVGLSWAAASVTLGPLVMPEPLILDDRADTAEAAE